MAFQLSRTLAVLAIVAVVGVAAAFAFGLVGDSYGETTVTIVDEDGTQLATVDVRVADTLAERYTGLSDTESLADGQGMLFVHPSTGEHAYVMRDMDFPLDIVFVAENGTITRIHHAPVPPPGTGESELTRYRGTGKYVLEVPMGFTNESGVGVGDRLVFDLDGAGTTG